MALKNASLRFGMRVGGADVDGSPINVDLRGQVDTGDLGSLERDTIDYTGSGTVTEQIPTVIRPGVATYNLSGFDAQLVELIENPGATVEWDDWDRPEHGVLHTSGRRIGADWQLVGSGSAPGWRFWRTRITGPFNDFNSDNRQQGTAISNRILTQRKRRVEMFNPLGGLYRYIDYDTGENLIAPAGTRSTRTDPSKEGLVPIV